MATVAEKSGTLASLIDDIASTLTGLSSGAWTDADADVTNDQSDDSWSNNGRVLNDPNTGQTLLMYVSTEYRDMGQLTHYGIRFVRSDDWDTSNTVPSGNTNVDSRDPFSGSVTNDLDTSFNSVSRYSDLNLGLWVYDGGANLTRSNLATKEVTYSISGRSDGIEVPAWTTADGTYGYAGYLCFEYVDDKLYGDGNTPVATVCRWNGEDSGVYHHLVATYGWQELNGRNESRSNESDFTDGEVGFLSGKGVIQKADWGITNPSGANSDFIYRHPVVCLSSGGDTPVAFLNDAIPNDVDSGAAHGDTINDADGTTYRIFRQSGASVTESVSAGLRYE